MAQITSREISKFSQKIANRFEAINVDYIKTMAKHIKDIGKLDYKDIDRLKQMARMNSNVKAINERIMQEANISYKQLTKIYDASSKKLYKGAAKQYQKGAVKQVPHGENKEIQKLLNGVKRQSAGTFSNLSRTTIKSLKYNREVDRAILAVKTGGSSVDREIKRIIKSKAVRGVRVQYPTGYTRRLDSALRMNIDDGLLQIKNEQERIMGEEFGADGVEIDAHGMCAPDHQDFQGRQFPIKEFYYMSGKSRGRQKMDTGRDISTCNCTHSVHFVILGEDKPQYTKTQLNKMARDSNKKITVGDKTMTRYEAGQYMRSLETQMRYTQEQLLVGETENLKIKLKSLKSVYNQVSEEAGLAKDWSRTKI